MIRQFRVGFCSALVSDKIRDVRQNIDDEHCVWKSFQTDTDISSCAQPTGDQVSAAEAVSMAKVTEMLCAIIYHLNGDVVTDVTGTNKGGRCCGDVVDSPLCSQESSEWAMGRSRCGLHPYFNKFGVRSVSMMSDESAQAWAQRPPCCECGGACRREADEPDYGAVCFDSEAVVGHDESAQEWTPTEGRIVIVCLCLSTKLWPATAIGRASGS